MNPITQPDQNRDLAIRKLSFEYASPPPAPWHQRHETLLGVLLLASLIIVPMLLNHWGNCIFAPTEIHPAEHTTKEITFLRRHWFGKTEYIKLEARRDENGDWKWMAKSPKTGEWYTFFSSPID